MEKHIITYYEIASPTVDNNNSTGYALGQRWFNSITGVEYIHIKNGIWIETIIPNYDFLFVDVWTGDEGSTIGGIDGVGFVTDEGDVYEIKIINDQQTTIAGAGSEPYIPISQTTIFIHPTTFERYLFDGTIMVVYNDIYEIVPKYLEYNALLTPFTSTLVPKVLNQSDSNYIGDVTWTYNISEYIGSNNKIRENLTILDKIPNGNNHDDDFILGFYSGPGEVVINNDGLLFEGNRYSIQFKQRIPGTPPKIILAETNTIGDKVILTFDKKMNEYINPFWLGAVDMYLTINTSNNTVNLSNLEFINNQLVLSVDGIIEFNDIIMCELNPTNGEIFESLDFGIFSNAYFPVTNNTPFIPLEILNAYTNELGTEIILEFNLNISPTSNTSGIEIYNSLPGNLLIFNNMNILRFENKKVILEFTGVKDSFMEIYLVYYGYGITSTSGVVLSEQLLNYIITNNIAYIGKRISIDSIDYIWNGTEYIVLVGNTYNSYSIRYYAPPSSIDSTYSYTYNKINNIWTLVYSVISDTDNLLSYWDIVKGYWNQYYTTYSIGTDGNPYVDGVLAQIGINYPFHDIIYGDDSAYDRTWTGTQWVLTSTL